MDTKQTCLTMRANYVQKKNINHLRFSTYHIWECMCDDFKKKEFWLSGVEFWSSLMPSAQYSHQFNRLDHKSCILGPWTNNRFDPWAVLGRIVRTSNSTVKQLWTSHQQENYLIWLAIARLLFQVSNLELRCKSYEDQIEDLEFSLQTSHRPSRLC